MIRKREDSSSCQTFHEELGNVITHGLGFFLSLAACVALIYSAVTKGDSWHIASAIVYGSALVILYLCSTLYHAAKDKTKEVLQRLDHMSIYLLIAGTYMPITMVALKGFVGHVLFGLECSLCLIGVTFKAVFGAKWAVISGIFYLMMGWLAIFAIQPIYQALPLPGVIWLLVGGLFYTLGFVFFALDRKYHYFHTIWHVFVLGGSLSHFFTIFFYVMP